MPAPPARKPAAAAKLIAELQNVKMDLLSAQCAADRLRQQFSLKEIVALGERQTLERAIASARSLARFFSQLEAEISVESDDPKASFSSSL